VSREVTVRVLEPEPSLVKAVACWAVRDNEPIGISNYFGPGTQDVYRFIKFSNAGGRHKVELKAYHNGEYYKTREDTFTDTTPETAYNIWFWDKRKIGSWHEIIFLDGRRIGEIKYSIGEVDPAKID
jgi:hypothetical protein